MRKKQYIVGRYFYNLRSGDLKTLSLIPEKKHHFLKRFSQFKEALKQRQLSCYYSSKVVLTISGTLLLICLTTTLLGQPTNQSLQNQINDLQQTISIWKATLLAVAIGFGVFSTLLVLYFNKSVDLKKQQKEWEAEKRVEQMEENLIKSINDRAETIQLFLNQTDKEQTLLNIKKIYLWGEEDSTHVRKILKIAGFNSKNLIFENGKSADNYDILFINNEKGELCNNKKSKGNQDRPQKDFKLIMDKIKAQPDTVCIFYYNTNFSHLPMDDLKFEVKHRVNFATNPSQIYGNLLNTLKYHDRLNTK